MNTSHIFTILILSLSLNSLPLTAASRCEKGMGKTEDMRAKVALGMAQAAGGNAHISSLTSLDALLSLIGIGYTPKVQTLLATYLGDSVANKANSLANLNVDRPGLKVKSAFNVWVQDGFKLKPSYSFELRRIFNAGPEIMDVTHGQAVADTANAWIGDRTENMLGKVVTPDMITADLVALLVNAIYFKGSWFRAFDIKLTKDLPFWGVDKVSGKIAKSLIPTMMKKDEKIQASLFTNRDKKPHVVVVRLPYEGNSHAMYIAFGAKLSSESTKAIPVYDVDTNVDVHEVFTNYIVKGEAFNQELSDQMMREFTMPKFTITSKMKDVQRELAGVGLGELLQPGVLTGMSDDPRLYLGFILQVAKIEVDEFGSKAAAATVGGVRSLSAPVEPVFQSLRINGPFSYAIRDEEQGINLFEGVFSAP